MHQGTPLRRFAAAACAAALCAGLAGCAPSEPVSRTDFFMSTLVTQQAYGRGAEEALARAADTLGEWEQRFSLYEEDSDVCRINAAAGVQPVQVSEATAALLAQAKALAQTTDGAFALTVAPITLAWGVHSDSPRVVPPEECAALAALVDDSALQLGQGTAFLQRQGRGAGRRGRGVRAGRCGKRPCVAGRQRICARHKAGRHALARGFSRPLRGRQRLAGLV